MIDAAIIAEIRSTIPPDDTELTESLKAHGWRKEFPAIQDENGVTLVGNRRLRIARALGIEPVVVTATFGEGEAADDQRMIVAITSNVGGVPATKAERQQLAIRLFQQLNWTQQRIGNALGVSQMQASRYLAGIQTSGLNSPPRDTKRGRPKGRRQPPPEKKKRDEKIVALHDQGLNASQISAEVGIVPRAVSQIVEHEVIRREARADPIIDPSELSISQQEKNRRWREQEAKRLYAVISQAERQSVLKRWNEDYLHQYKEQLARADAVIAARRGAMTSDIYKLILSCLHPDSRKSVSERKLAEAFRTFKDMQVVLVKEAEMPAPEGLKLPDTMDEWDALRQKASEARRGRRTNRKTAVAP